MITTRTVQNQFPRWTTSQCMAYRAGALAGLRGASVVEGFEYENPEDDGLDDDVTLFYLRGFADAIGDDSARGEWWFEEITDWEIKYQWWR